MPKRCLSRKAGIVRCCLYSLFAFTSRRKGRVSIFPRPAETGRRFFPFSAVPHSRLTRRTDIWTGWISDSACRLPGYKTVPTHGIAVPPPEKRQNLYGWSRSWFVSSVIAVLRGAASYYLAEYGGKIAAGTIMQFLTDLLQRFVCSC